MYKRLLFSLALAVAVSGSATASDALNNGVQSAPVAGSLGPTTDSGSNVSGALQPAGGQVLQDSTATDAASGNQLLQSPAAAGDQLRVFMAGEADGSQLPADGSGVAWWVWLIPLGLGSLAASLWLAKRRQPVMMYPEDMAPVAEWVDEAATGTPPLTEAPATKAKPASKKSVSKKTKPKAKPSKKPRAKR